MTGENDSDEILTDHRVRSWQTERVLFSQPVERCKNALLLAEKPFGALPKSWLHAGENVDWRKHLKPQKITK
jgi:hypothetical protein